VLVDETMIEQRAVRREAGESMAPSGGSQQRTLDRAVLRAHPDGQVRDIAAMGTSTCDVCIIGTARSIASTMPELKWHV
jgi:hypothetical protein